MTEPTDDRCAHLKAEIDELQAEFEKTWLAMSAGGGDAQVPDRGTLQDKRIEFNRVAVRASSRTRPCRAA